MTPTPYRALFDHVLTRGVSVHGCRVAREAGELSDHYPVVASLGDAPGKA